ncbi:MAG TPA: ABC transporter permease [Steroidobacteraceae bacterium]
MSGSIPSLIAKRIAVAALTLLLVSMIVFSITSLLPGDAAQALLGQNATPAALAALRAQLGLDQPAIIRYLHWLGGLLTGHPGRSLSDGLPVGVLIGKRLPESLLLAGLTTAVSVPLALALGIVAAMYRGSWLDRALTITTLSMVAVPEFLVATAGVLIFAVELHWLSALTFVLDHPTLGQLLRGYTLPVVSLCFAVTAQMARMTRAAVIDQLNQPYAEMAALKGVGLSRRVLVHALPNAVGPIANAIALSLSYLLGGAIIVETIFDYPGVARLMVDAVSNRDMPVLQACAMIFSAGYLGLVLIADVCSILSNPKLRRS